MPPPTDTSPDVERRLAAAYRAMPPARKWGLVASAYVQVRQLHAAGHRMRHPAATAADVNREWVALNVGKGPWSARLDYAGMSAPAEHVRPVRYVLDTFDALDIRYAVGGSFASSTHGYARYTPDADVMAEPFPGKERAFAMRFPAAEWYADEGMVRDAVAGRASFNLLHLPTGFKIDVFLRKDRAFEREVLARRISAAVFGEGEGEYGVITAEESVLLNLEWFRLGGERWDAQWNDLLGVLRVQADRLDAGYLDRWAADLGVADLLSRARGDAG